MAKAQLGLGLRGRQREGRASFEPVRETINRPFPERPLRAMQGSLRRSAGRSA